MYKKEIWERRLFSNKSRYISSIVSNKEMVISLINYRARLLVRSWVLKQLLISM